MTTYDRYFSTEDTSSVIEAVYYNSDTQELFVELTREDALGNPVVAGYEGVPENVYVSLELENSNKLAGKFGSVGAYWNSFIKPNFKGIDTNGLELVHADDVDEADEADLEALLSVGSSSPVDTDDEPSTFVVLFTEKGRLGTVQIVAADGEDAMDRFEQIAEIAGWDSEPVAITQFFVEV